MLGWVRQVARQRNNRKAKQKENWIRKKADNNICPGNALGGNDLGFGLNVDDDTQLGLNLAYFFTNRWNKKYSHQLHLSMMLM